MTTETPIPETLCPACGDRKTKLKNAYPECQDPMCDHDLLTCDFCGSTLRIVPDGLVVEEGPGL